MILVDDRTLHAYEWLVTSNYHFNATFRPSRASSGIYVYVHMYEREGGVGERSKGVGN